MRGICSFYENLSDSEGIFNSRVLIKNKALLLSGEKVFCTQREGAVLCIKGNVSNLDDICQKFDIKDEAQEKILLSLFLMRGESFVKELEGDFVIVVLDEINKKLHIFTDFDNLSRVYIAPIKNGFLFSLNLSEIITCPFFTPVINQEGLLKLFSMPYAYSGEFISRVHRISGEEYITVSKDGACIRQIRKKIISKEPDKLNYKISYQGDNFLYALVKKGETGMLMPPHIMASVVQNGEALNGHLINAQISKGYPSLMKEEMDFYSYEKEVKNKLLCNICDFSYETCQEIERAESFYLHYKLYLSTYLGQVNSFCKRYGIKNNTDILKPACLKWLYENGGEKIVMGTENKVNLAQDIRKKTAELCENLNEPVFRVLRRRKMADACYDAEESFLLFVLRVNKFFREFEPYLEFRTD